MQKASLVYGLDGVENLMSEPEGGREGEGAARLGAPQLGQVPTLQLHHHVVEAVVPAAADEAAHVVLACGGTENMQSVTAETWRCDMRGT